MHRSLPIALASLVLVACGSASLRSVPYTTPEDALAPLVVVAQAGSHSCVIGYAEAVQCMHEARGQRTIVDVPGTEGAVDLAISSQRGCVMFGSGSVACFGWDGAGTTASRRVPGMTDAFELSVAGDVVCARSESGHTVCARGDERAYPVGATRGDVGAIAFAVASH